MPALAYVLLPLSGTIAFLIGRSRRMRFHGLQAIAVGAVWGVAAYVGSLLSARVTQVVFLLGAVVWIVLIFGTAVGRDPRLPGAAFFERALAAEPEED